MKVYRSEDLRRAKTDKLDSRIIANYGIEHWFTMEEFNPAEDKYAELKFLGQQYRHYMKLHIAALQKSDTSDRSDDARSKRSVM